jgi:hypothetical protein
MDQSSQKALITATFRVSLLLDAMGNLYKAETGGVTGMELLGLIKDPSKLPSESYLRTLITLIKDSLKNLPEDIANKLLTQLAARYDRQLQGKQGPKVTEPITTFMNLWNPKLPPEATNPNPA